jgi:hypothetical protein
VDLDEYVVSKIILLGPIHGLHQKYSFQRRELKLGIVMSRQY